MIEKALEIDIKIEAGAWVDELPELCGLVNLSAAAAVAACDLDAQWNRIEHFDDRRC